MRLVYFSPVPWESYTQRPHKFVEWFHGRTGDPILWVDPYPTRFPGLRDIQHLSLPASTCKCDRTKSWLTVLKPGGLPIEPMPFSASMNSLLWRKHINKIIDFANDSKTFFAIAKPSALALTVLKIFHNFKSLYDAMDNFPEFYQGLSRYSMMQRERKIAQRVGIILASSTERASRWGRIHNDVRLVHNGLDQEATASFVPSLKPSKVKVFGYLGTIASWFDWEWVGALAEARPDDEIRLVGPVLKRPSHKMPRNVILFPACEHLSALKAMAEFHVGLIPFMKNALTAAVDPIKYYEYRALGLPVLSTDFGEMSLRVGERGVFITKSPIDLPILANAAILHNSEINHTKNFSIQNSWNNRFDASNIL